MSSLSLAHNIITVVYQFHTTFSIKILLLFKLAYITISIILFSMSVNMDMIKHNKILSANMFNICTELCFLLICNLFCFSL